MEDVVAASALCAAAYYNYIITHYHRKTRKPWKKRRWWMTAVNRSRSKQTMQQMFNELTCELSGEFDNFCRMSSSDFEILLQKVSPLIAKNDTKFREAIPPKVRLAITLRFLASGDSYKSLHYLFKVSSQIISKIVPEVCSAINEVLKDEVKMPSNSEEWLIVEEGFKKNFPHCVGCLDGKHIIIQAPFHSGSEYYNYKKSFSIVLLALVNSNYQIMFADIGSQGRISDGGVFMNSLLWEKICAGEMNFPPPSPLPGSTKSVPYVILADGAFALSCNIMKPYPGNHDFASKERTFNKRLSSSRVKVENVFGIMAAVFRILRKPIGLQPGTVSLLTMTCVLLHNYLRKSRSSRDLYTPCGSFDSYDNEGNLIQPGTWREEVTLENSALRCLRATPRRSKLAAKIIRDEFSSYFYNNT